MMKIDIYDLIKKFDLSDKEKIAIAKLLVLDVELNTGLDDLSKIYYKLNTVSLNLNT